MLATSLRTFGGRLSTVGQLTTAFRNVLSIGSNNSPPCSALNTLRYSSSISIANAIGSQQQQQQQQQQQLKTVDSRTPLRDCQQICDNVNALVAERTEGRLFAVVHLCGKQFKVTAGDIILVEGYWAPDTGDQLRLDKVLCAGGADFTLVGRPLLKKGLVEVQATVIEKTLTHTKTHFRKKRRKQYMRINFHRSPNTMIRINSVELHGEVDASAGAKAAVEEPLRIF